MTYKIRKIKTKKEELKIKALKLSILALALVIAILIFTLGIVANFVTELEIQYKAQQRVIQQEKELYEEIINTIFESSIEARIKEIAQREGVDGELLVKLAKCESGLNPKAVGDNGHSFGLYQINLKYHNISPICAMDVECSTLWTARMIKAGKLHLWTCAKKIK